MKKFYKLILLLLLFTFGLSSSFGFIFSKKKKKITITGSTTVLPIAQKCAEVYMQKNSKGTGITVNGGGSSVGIAALIDQRTDIANASRNIKEKEVSKAKEKGVNPVGTVVAKDGLAIIINKSVTGIKEIDIETIKAIYKGEISNWSELGGPNKEIVIVSRDTASGTYETFENKVMQKDKVLSEALMLASNKAVLTTVNQTPYSIGYVGIGYISDEVTVLTVEGVYPTNKTVNDGSYKISRSLYMYTDGNPSGDIKRFLDFILSPEGQKIVGEVGYVPLI